eukprot:gnl/Hemi2/17236_TR5739_c0_g2_i1.p1 gnl/Hemi2/17236_TR5739_c0_g2~~gnl/Hemi2/17236_TR5739_c0_g2_i1.p1  ORF type:complete len:435 (+),score=119.18 gnl/Hemi2/17236_TR5739_c0_g2_i1:94-1398(+)
MSSPDEANLIVNYLPTSVTEDSLRNIFAPYGSIESCKLITDKFTSQTLGYGFVRFSTVQMAQNAISSLNGLKLENKTLKVSVAKPSHSHDSSSSHSARRSSSSSNNNQSSSYGGGSSSSALGSDSPNQYGTNASANLYVSGLGQSVTKADLDQAFAPFGKIADSKVLFDNNTGLSRGIGFVRFVSRSDAERALGSLNDTVLCNSRVKVKFADTSLDKARKTQRSGGGSSSAGSGGLLGAGPMRGQHQPSFMRFDPMAGSRGTMAGAVGVGGSMESFGMGMLEEQSYTPAQYTQAQVPLLYTPPGGGPPQLVYPPMGVPTLPANTLGLGMDLSACVGVGGFGTSPVSTDIGGEFTLFVYHLPQDADDNLLYRLFSPFGAVLSVKIVRDANTGVCKSYGFVTMRTLQEAQNAITNLHGYNVPGTNKRLQVSFKSKK